MGRDRLPLSRVQTPIRIGPGMDGEIHASRPFILHLAQDRITSRRAHLTAIVALTFCDSADFG
jgi:hypothetical protein